MPTGRIVLERDVTGVVDETKELFNVTEKNMSESVRIICEIAATIKKEFLTCIDNLLSVIQEKCSNLMNSRQVLQALKIYQKYE